MVNDVAKHIKLDLSRNRGTVVVYARYADTKTHNLHIAVTNNGNLVSLTDAVAAIMYIKLPSGTKYANSLVRIGNELRYTFSTQDLSEVGQVTASVYVAYKDGSKFTTPEFTVEVYKNIEDLDVGSMDEESSNTYQVITDILSEAKLTAEQADQTADKAKDDAEEAQELVDQAKEYVDTTKEYMDDTESFKASVESTKSAVEILKDDVDTAKAAVDTTKGLIDTEYSTMQNLNASAAGSAEASANSATASTNSATASATSASDSKKSAENSSSYASSSNAYATSSKSYAVGGTGTRTGEDTDNANYYYEQAKKISEGLSGSLLPMGTITFSQLSSQTKVSGCMYNISDGFDSTTDFKDGGGIHYPAGTNVYCTSDGMWDCLAGATSTMDSALNTVTFEEASTRENIVTGENHMALFGKIKKWISSLGTAAFKDITDDYSATGSDPVDGKAVASAISTKSDVDHTHTVIYSHVGMIIQSTTLDTQEKVIAIYGGTTWQKIEGQFLLGASSSYTVNSTGGEATHTLTVEELPSHTHSFNQTDSLNYPAGASAGNYVATKTTGSGTITSGSAGSGTAHNNMPPYKAVYIWERTA